MAAGQHAPGRPAQAPRAALVPMAVLPVGDAARSGGTVGRQAQGPFTASCKLGRRPSPRGDKGTRSGDRSEVSAGVAVTSRGPGPRREPFPRGQRPSLEVGSGGAPGGLPYQARMPCSVDTPELPCGIAGLCTAFKSPTPKFTKLLAAAGAEGAGGGAAG